MCFFFTYICFDLKVSSAPTDESAPTILVLSSDGVKELTPSAAVEALKEMPLEKIVSEKAEEKPIQIVQPEQNVEEPVIKLVQLVQPEEKKSEQPILVQLVQPEEKSAEPTVKLVEQPVVKIVEQPTVKVEESKPIEKPQPTIEIIPSTTVESPKKDDKPIEVVTPQEAKSEKHDEPEKNTDDIIDHSSFMDQIYNALFGGSHLKQKPVTSSPRVVEISFEHSFPSAQPKFTETASHLQDVASHLNDDDDDDDDFITVIPVNQHHREEPRHSSMLQPFLSFFNSLNSMPSIFRFNTPERQSYTAPVYTSAPRSIFDFGGSFYRPEPRPRFFFA